MTVAAFLDSGLTSHPISLFRELGAYEALWNREGTSFRTIAKLFKTQRNAIPSDFVSPEEARSFADKTIGLLEKGGVRKFGIQVHGTEEYPKRLRDAWHPIELLYYQGWWDLVHYPRLVAVVGTRNPSEQGVKRARKLVSLLVKDNFGIVSGLAKGVDTVAHETAINAGGFTIAVIGTPLNSTYPQENFSLQRRIAEKYLLISQIPVYRYSQQT